jgi:ABC-2 type transport system ATP-binding protein
MVAISVDALRKSYGTFEAVRGISFDVDDGEVFALLGPNGAGKTTTLEILEGFRHPTSGAVHVLGLDPGPEAAALRRRVGIVLQEASVEPYLTVREVLTRNAAYYERPRKVEEVVELVGLHEKIDARVKTLSGGQQRRLDVGLGIVGNPELLFLDEPTTGFDPSARRGAWEMVRTLADTGTTIILTTHYMEEAQNLARRVAVISRGVIVASGSPDTIGGRADAAVRIRFLPPPDIPLDQLPVPATIVEGHAEIRTDDELHVLHDLTGWALDHRVALEGLTVERPSLEDVYLQLTAVEEPAA